MSNILYVLFVTILVVMTLVITSILLGRLAGRARDARGRRGVREAPESL